MNYKVIIGDKKIEEEQVILGKKTWPEFMQHDAIVNKYWSIIYSHFLDFQFAIYSNNKIVGIGNTVPIYWENEFKNLPKQGLDWAFMKTAKDNNNKLTPNLLIGVQILINPELRSKGLSYKLLDIMKQVGKEHKINHIALPIRPTQKHLYPLTPMTNYINWENKKNGPFDSWIRVHIKAGGTIISICPESMTIKGTVNDWQEWTGLCFQESGYYTIENALCPIKIDVSKNTGEYIEPNVWIVH